MSLYYTPSSTGRLALGVLDWLPTSVMFCVKGYIRRAVLALGGLAVRAGPGLTVGVCWRRLVISCLK
eukprot:1154310-Pelagomonas_calceolata.AAC.4